MLASAGRRARAFVRLGTVELRRRELRDDHGVEDGGTADAHTRVTRKRDVTEGDDARALGLSLWLDRMTAPVGRVEVGRECASGDRQAGQRSYS